jgi:hypothetical protein
MGVRVEAENGDRKQNGTETAAENKPDYDFHSVGKGYGG